MRMINQIFTNASGRSHSLPEIIIHIGLHKTGTTALQTFFSANEKKFNEHGVFFPLASRENCEHQVIHSNLSWELMRHDLFDPQLGTLDDLINEIRSNSEVKKWIISGEGISRLKDPVAFLAHFRSFPITVVAYFRDPIEASPSLYSEQLKAGCNLTYNDWISSKFARRLNGNIIMKRWHSSLTRTGRLLNCIGFRQPALFGGISLKVIQRPLSSLHQNNLKADFLRQVGLSRVAQSFAYSKQSTINRRISGLECLGLIFLNTLHLTNPRLSDREKINDRVDIRRALKLTFPDQIKPFDCTAAQRLALQKIFHAAAAKGRGESQSPQMEAADPTSIPDDLLNWLRQFKAAEYDATALDAAIDRARGFAAQQASNNAFKTSESTPADLKTIAALAL